MKRLLILLVVTVPLFVNGQSAPWYQGSVVTETDSVLAGTIYLESACDVILIRTGATVKVYPAHKIRAVYFYDEGANVNRRFVSCRETQTSMKSARLWEVVVDGEVKVLRHQKLLFAKNSGTNEVTGYTYVIQHDEQLVPLRQFRRMVFPVLLKNDEHSLRTFVKVNRLSIHSDASAIQIIQFYNQRGTMMAGMKR